MRHENMQGNVLSIFIRPRDRQWSEEEIQQTWSIFSLMGADFIQQATQRELYVLAAFWRREAERLPEKAEGFLRVAKSFDKLATISWKIVGDGRRPGKKLRPRVRLVWRDGVLLEPALLNS